MFGLSGIPTCALNQQQQPHLSPPPQPHLSPPPQPQPPHNVVPSNISAITSETTKLVLERYVRQSELKGCMSDNSISDNSVMNCACMLAGTPDLNACRKGFHDVQTKFSQQSQSQDPFTPLSWCITNVPNVEQRTYVSDDARISWLTGCVNGIRK